MLHRYRRFWALPAAFLLALPLVVGILGPNQAASLEEARELAPAPTFPRSGMDWLRLPGHVDAYLRDHFGLRSVLIHAYGALMNQASFRSGNEQVLVGPGGRMFFRGDAMIQQSSGIIRRDEEITRTAVLLAEVNAALTVRDIRLLIAPPPNASTIYGNELPLWARNSGKRTEYDLLLDELAARGIPTKDLRPVLQAARAEGNVYRLHDSHWTDRGKLAAFNAIVEADAHLNWLLDAASVLGPPTTITGGDLARLLSVSDNVTETDQILTLPPEKRTLLRPEASSAYVMTADREGPTIMIIGDSFTADSFASMVLQHTGRVAWVPHDRCGFDWEWIGWLHPNEVWWMPTERLIVCTIGGGAARQSR